jgi:hypothetical protein
MLDGDGVTGRALVRDFINATMGFPALAAQLGISDTSLMRMLGPGRGPADGQPGGGAASSEGGGQSGRDRAG